MESLFHRGPGVLRGYAAALALSLVLADPVGAIAAQDAGVAMAAGPVVFQNQIPSVNLAFLNEFAGKTSKDVVKDKRFHALVKGVIPKTMYHYGSDMPLWVASEDMLDGRPLPVSIREGRYVMVATEGGLRLAGRGFFWFDMQEGIALGGVYFHPVNGEPTPTLAVFSRQLKDTTVSMNQLPAEFARDLAQWILDGHLRFVTPRYFIPENGKKYVLVHDEDYCETAPGGPAPRLDVCQQLNAEAADADLDAAYFMEQSRHAANATAWTLNPAQTAWLDVRNQSCGGGVNGMPCRIRLTRQRTRALLQHQ